MNSGSKSRRFCGGGLPDGAGGHNVTPLAATQIINTRHAQVVDVRGADQFATGSLPNARNIPLTEIGQRFGELRRIWIARNRASLAIEEGGQRVDGRISDELAPQMRPDIVHDRRA